MTQFIRVLFWDSKNQDQEVYVNLNRVTEFREHVTGHVIVSYTDTKTGKVLEGEVFGTEQVAMLMQCVINPPSPDWDAELDQLHAEEDAEIENAVSAITVPAERATG